MLFCAPPETRFDLRFGLLGFPVRVSPLFWVAAVMLAPRLTHNISGPLGPAPLLIWVAVFFVSILLHELGHGLMFRRFRVRSHIVLHGFGGFAAPDEDVRGPRQAILVSLAGPAVNFLIAFLVWVSNEQTGWAGRHLYLGLAAGFLYSANLFWGMFNLLPIWPLDGGQVCRQVCYLRRVRQPVQLSLKIAIGTAGLLVLLGLLDLTGQLDKLLQPVLEALPRWFPSHWFTQLIPGEGSELMLLFDALMGYACWEELRAYRRPTYYTDDYGDDRPWR